MTIYSRVRIPLAFTILFFLCCPSQMRGGEASLAWNASPSLTAAGYNLYYGLTNGPYSSTWNAGNKLTATITGLTSGATYYIAAATYDTNGNVSALSAATSYTVPPPPSIVVQPLTQSAIAGLPVTLTVTAAGAPPLSFQWMDGLAPFAGGTTSSTTSSLSWLAIGSGNAGNYSVVVSNPGGSITSSIATLTVLVRPSITQQPQSQSVVATTPASFSSSAAGTAPLSIQWYSGTTAIAGATNSSLAWTSVAASNAGNYQFTVSNAVGAITSSVAVLTVLPSNTFASVAGTYNGLFFQTNADGTPAVSEASAGFLGNCVVAANGVFSTKIYLGGITYSLSGNFNSSGNHVFMFGALDALKAVLQLDMSNGTQQITGSVSSTAAGNAWTNSLVAVMATAAPQFTGATLAISPGLSPNAPTNSGLVGGVVLNGLLTLSGTLGDTESFSQTVPISQNGSVPVYANLYNYSGLLEGWINLSSAGVTGSLTWIRPSGVLVPGGYPQGFDTLVNVTGTTLSQ